MRKEPMAQEKEKKKARKTALRRRAIKIDVPANGKRKVTVSIP